MTETLADVATQMCESFVATPGFQEFMKGINRAVDTIAKTIAELPAVQEMAAQAAKIAETAAAAFMTPQRRKTLAIWAWQLLDDLLQAPRDALQTLRRYFRLASVLLHGPPDARRLRVYRQRLPYDARKLLRPTVARVTSSTRLVRGPNPLAVLINGRGNLVLT